MGGGGEFRPHLLSKQGEKMLPNMKTVIVMKPQAATSASVNTAYFDTKGYDYLTLDVIEGTQEGPSATTTLALRERDTVPANWAGADVITQFTGGTEVDSTHGFVNPTPSSTKENIYRFNVDLRGRKRYIVLGYDPTSSSSIAAYALLSRAEDGVAMETAVTTLDGARSVVSG